MKEDYVSFECAKLLKEKGFNGESEIGCRCGFYEQNKEYPSQINLVYDDLNNSELGYNECLRFTLQMAMKYLREVHKIIITIDFDEYELTSDNKKVGYGWNIQKIENPTEYFKISTVVYDTYEEACEEAIKYCLTNLI